ncbi:hypothetical protein ETD86_04870 [Nonomuraea turkmeniaca]|uniref:FAD-binding oxidoreductase n=1 Tax=Nonomuraea turkmeniaca TaxID=103838 RepID=A0A5S4GDU8_9ACTN|nr:hypothetical protein [Nonomuraea turkmeniaca]TMR24250.1 hypothetical protein ETD86_04870 [Nonomuraea turkmeniaca]
MLLAAADDLPIAVQTTGHGLPVAPHGPAPLSGSSPDAGAISYTLGGGGIGLLAELKAGWDPRNLFRLNPA